VSDEEPNIHPDDLEDLERTFARVTRDEEEGYAIEIFMSRSQARDMLAAWFEAMMGVPESIGACFIQYAHIMSSLMEAVQEDDRENDDLN
jgi:hypothetical protein